MKTAGLLNELTHHAYCLIGDDTTRETLIAELNKKHKIKTAGNPDFFDRRFEVLTIDDAREVKSLAETMPTTADGKKIFILTMNGITSEAQNALLKLLEEPPQQSHFFLILPSAHLLLPTMKSRLSFLGEMGNAAVTSDDEFAKLADKLLKTPLKARLDAVKTFMDEITKEKRTKQDAVDLMAALEEAVYKKGVKKNVAALEAIMHARKFATDRAPSMKMLLEYVALSI